MQRQTSFFPKSRREHGGSLAVGKRRAVRPLNPRLSHHLVLKSHLAVGGRCLFRHKRIVKQVLRKAAGLFRIKVYHVAIAGNHIHVLVKGPDRESLQNFFRVFAGHTAQQILRAVPLSKRESASQERPRTGRRLPCQKNRRRFWSFLIYSRLVSWGREYRIVFQYIQQNLSKTRGLLAQQKRIDRNTS